MPPCLPASGSLPPCLPPCLNASMPQCLLNCHVHSMFNALANRLQPSLPPPFHKIQAFAAPAPACLLSFLLSVPLAFHPSHFPSLSVTSVPPAFRPYNTISASATPPTLLPNAPVLCPLTVVILVAFGSRRESQGSCHIKLYPGGVTQVGPCLTGARGVSP